jgi:hypothetical protein
MKKISPENIPSGIRTCDFDSPKGLTAVDRYISSYGIIYP